MNRILSVLLPMFLVVTAFQARADDSADAVTIKNNAVYFVQGDKQEAITENVGFPAEVEVYTNGDFQVAQGKKRSLQDGQLIRRDGWLVNTDGSIEPVFDHLAMKAGKVIVVRDGQTEILTQPISFPNNLHVNPDGSCFYPDGSRTRLADGQLFRLDGTAIPAKDTITLKNGHVVVQKQGSLIPLSSVQIMGMNDGTRVYGDGAIQQPNGSKTKLREGQTVLIDGVLIGH